MWPHRARVCSWCAGRCAKAAACGRSTGSLDVISVKIYISELLILIAWFCGPAVLLALAGEVWFVRRKGLFRSRRASVVIGLVATILLVPVASIALMAAGIGRSPLEGQDSGFIVPWFWQSFLAAVVVFSAVVAWLGRGGAK